MQWLRWSLRLILLSLLAVIPALSHAGVMISVTITPPELPVYEQPVCPEAGWIWVPGYWAWGDNGYYWVPGEWVPAPFEGALWTPPYWDWDDGHYVFNPGYWGTTVGYYGGIDYGFGYMGVGYVGGMWRGGVFEYNTAVTRVDPAVIRNTYVDRTIVEQNTIVNSRRVAYSGGPDGIRHQPTPMERMARSQRHTQPTAQQQSSLSAARADRTSYAKYNGGHPHLLVVARPTESARAGAGMAARKVEPRGSAAASRPDKRTESSSAGRTEQPSPEARKSPSQRTPVNRSEPTSRSEISPRNKSTNSNSARTAEERHSVSGARARSESHPLEEPKPETRAEAPHAQTEPRPAPATHAESRPESRSTPQPEGKHRSELSVEHPTESHPKSTAHPQPESQPIPQDRSHPATVTHPEAPPHAAHAPKEESHSPKPEAHATPPPKRESHPVPETHPQEQPKEPKQR